MATDKKITYKDQRLTKDQQKKIKPITQAGTKNFLGKQEMVTVPKRWLSSPDHVVAELAYITPREQKILIDKNLYGSLKGKPNRGPGGIMSLQGGDSGGLGGNDSDGKGGDKGEYSVQDDLTDYAQNVGKTAKDTGGFKGDALGGSLEKVGTTIKDFIKGGGLTGMAVRGIVGLVDDIRSKTGPTNDLGVRDGYNMANVAGPKGPPAATRDGGGKIISPTGVMTLKEITPIGPSIDEDRMLEIVEQQKAAGVPNEGLITNFNFGTFSNPIYGKDLG